MKKKRKTISSRRRFLSKSGGTLAVALSVGLNKKALASGGTYYYYYYVVADPEY